MTPQFVDMSEWQPQNIDWQAYKAWSAQGDGISRVALRSSYGSTYTDSNFKLYQASALAAGIDQILYYHYAYPQYNTPQQEANRQKAVVGAIRPQDLLILDFEENTPNATAEWAYEWLVQQEANYGKLPGIYASSAYILQRLQDSRLKKYPLWLANWQFTPDERPPCPPPWTSYEFVQYTDKASIPGITGLVDCNIFLGKEDFLMPTTLDLSNAVVAGYFNATEDPQIWRCRKTDFLLGHGILSFYQKFGGDALCGLSYLGLPISPELPVSGQPGVVCQRFERAVLCYDPSHILDNPPGAGPVYLLHLDKDPGQDPRIDELQAQIAQLEQLASVANLQQINTLATQIVQKSQVQ